MRDLLLHNAWVHVYLLYAAVLSTAFFLALLHYSSVTRDDARPPRHAEAVHEGTEHSGPGDDQ
jgi:hypothetical protein